MANRAYIQFTSDSHISSPSIWTYLLEIFKQLKVFINHNDAVFRRKLLLC